MTGKGLITADGPARRRLRRDRLRPAVQRRRRPPPATRAAICAPPAAPAPRTRSRSSATRPTSCCCSSTPPAATSPTRSPAPTRPPGPAVPLAGGAAGGPEKRHFHDGEASTDSVVAVALASSGPLGHRQHPDLQDAGRPVDRHPLRGPADRARSTAGPPRRSTSSSSGSRASRSTTRSSRRWRSPIPSPSRSCTATVRLRHVLGRTGDGAITVGTHIPASAVIEFTELDFDELLASGAGSVERGDRARSAEPAPRPRSSSTAPGAGARSGGPPAGGRGDHRRARETRAPPVAASTRTARWHGSRERREIETMPSSRSPSAEARPAPPGS